MNYRYIPDFLSSDERALVLYLGKEFSPNSTLIVNEHIKKVNEGTKGFSVLCSLTKTSICETVSQFQGDATVISDVPDLFYEIADRIADKVGISKDHVFFQYISLGSGGKVSKHYDAGMPGYVTYKCNICVSGPSSDLIYVDKASFSLGLGDLYCFEANFYKHWMEPSSSSRIVLSYGFIVPIEDLGYKDTDPRVKLSNRIWGKFIS